MRPVSQVDTPKSECRYQWSPTNAPHPSWLRRSVDLCPDLYRESALPRLVRLRPAPPDHPHQSLELSSPSRPSSRHYWPADNAAWSPCTAWYATRYPETSSRNRRQLFPAPRDRSAPQPLCTPQTPVAFSLPADASPGARLPVPRAAPPALPEDSGLP